ncbi:uncharacterized protein LOC129611632 [Condylostylus longicornis]|uniref:uncharacterized protein LOC129611632 n=1 Tax=Condylostylus longicornis TaxID=2530218 RepID=UPI00244E38FA|nr:uncharacterized protein LOC129611632 [Condylostylus longicornis]
MDFSFVKNETGFDSLPTEIIIKIFQNLDHYDLLSISRVCRRFLCILQHPKLLSETLLKINNITTIEQSPENVLVKSSRQFINIHFENSNIKLFGSLLLRSHLQLQSLTFESLELAENEIFIILRETINLIELKIIKCTFKEDECDITSVTNIIDENIMLPNLKILRYIDISNASRSILFKIATLIPKNNLKVFEVTVLKSTEEVVVICCNLILPILQNQCLSLQHVKISNFQNCCKPKIFNCLKKNSKNLALLSIVQTNSFSDADVVFIKENFRYLRSFELRSCHNLTNVSAIAIGELPLLEELKISECSGIITGINSGGIKNGILKNINLKLRKLHMIFLDINTDCMIKISEHLPNLKELIYRYPIVTGRIQCRITDYALQAILKNLTALEVLDLCGCSWLTDFGITGYEEETERQDGVSINRLTNLQVLNLIGCSNITDHFILHDFNLEKLKVIRIPELSLAGTKVLIKKCKFIEELEFQNDFDTEEILYLSIKHFPRLRVIKFSRFCSSSNKLMDAKIQRFNKIFGYVGFDCSCTICNRVKLLADVFRNRN